MPSLTTEIPGHRRTVRVRPSALSADLEFGFQRLVTKLRDGLGRLTIPRSTTTSGLPIGFGGAETKFSYSLLWSLGALLDDKMLGMPEILRYIRAGIRLPTSQDFSKRHHLAERLGCWALISVRSALSVAGRIRIIFRASIGLLFPFNILPLNGEPCFALHRNPAKEHGGVIRLTWIFQVHSSLRRKIMTMFASGLSNSPPHAHVEERIRGASTTMWNCGGELKTQIWMTLSRIRGLRCSRDQNTPSRDLL
ncbi:hypothetical protein BJX61DRAFT_157170 [Aspergillus egyptiacus]|nr:hypothetical protein BJX61DRAFT_157170 [Aspergillus egyptiacus]